MSAIKHFEHELTLSEHSSPAGVAFPAKLAYRTLGSASNPAILIPTCYGGTIDTTLTFLYTNAEKDGNNAPLSTSKYFVIVCGLLAGSESSSPSNAPGPFRGVGFPLVTYADNIALQYALCRHLGVEKLFAYIGFSMGGQQAYNMAAMHPEFVDRIVCIAGSAQTSEHNKAFLEGPRAALVNSSDFHGGRYTQPARKGVDALERVWQPWAVSVEWFEQKCWQKSGFDSYQDFLRHEASQTAESHDANDLLALLETWQRGDISVYHPEDKGDVAKALQRLTAKCLVMPGATDRYFRLRESEREVQHLRFGRIAPIPSVYGHLAGSGFSTPEDNEFMKKHIVDFLNDID